MSNLMRSVAMNNAALIHQHLSRRMDVHSMQEQQPPPGFYSSIIVSCLCSQRSLCIASCFPAL